MTRRVGLIGHSAAGKSTCLLALGIDRNAADMDVVFGTSSCPALVTALDWLANDHCAPELVVVSNHEQMLLEMRGAKISGQYGEQFARVLLVYLCKSREQLRKHLSRPTAGRRVRPPADQRYTIDHYDRFHILFSQLADQTVDCSGRSIEDVAAQVQEIIQSLQKSNVEL